jgi:threonylcarbamoyladenosine tRNA methylthiotransferase MtaB
MKRVSLHTLGCKLNFAETASIGKQFRDRGYKVVDFSEPSDVFVLNTCSVTERADRECRQLIRRVRRKSPNAYVIVMGCYAQLRPGEISSIDGVDLVLGAKEKFDLFEHTQIGEKEIKPVVHVSPIAGVSTFGGASSSESSERTRAFLKIQDGCDYSCSFCTIPLARGTSRSIPIDDIRSQAVLIAAEGYKEIVLTGVNVGDYGRKHQSNLLSLLKHLVLIDGIERIRVSSIEPNLLTEELMEFWLAEQKLCRHFHIPLQSGNDTILALMKRRYRTDVYSSKVEKIKSLCPEACVGADVLVGFPGETPELFEESYRYLRELPLSYLHVFTYSERPGTVATELAGSVEPRVRAERSERLRMLGIRKRRMFHESFVGKKVDVLFEHEQERGWWSGFTDQYVRVVAKCESALGNEIHKVEVHTANNENCTGELLAEHLEPVPIQFTESV